MQSIKTVEVVLQQAQYSPVLRLSCECSVDRLHPKYLKVAANIICIVVVLLLGG
ncbi:MAG: hypothetical protein HC795_07785 [Coleofasciculaceae cyanobacterium RL_1_1]|nr:hypothetical protein [Coleofasciculaceae cyanobacterium RL_1_1]